MTARQMPHLDGVRHSYVDAGGLRTHVAEAGDPEAEPVVLVHGWPQHWYAWRHLIGPLAADYRVICPDLRGFGWTEAPAGSYLKSQLAADLIALFDAMKLDRVRLAGHDWGGYAGFLVCLEAPERVSHYLAAGTVHPWVSQRRSPLTYLELAIRCSYQGLISTPVLGRAIVQRIPAFVRTILRLSSVGTPWDDEELQHFVAQWSEPERAAACVAIYRTFLTKELPQLLAGHYDDRRVEIPSLLLLGDRDPVIRQKFLGGGEANAPALQARVIEGVGHWLPEEAPQRVGAEMRELFRTPSGSE